MFSFSAEGASILTTFPIRKPIPLTICSHRESMIPALGICHIWLNLTPTPSNDTLKEFFHYWTSSNSFSIGKEYFQALSLQEPWCCWHQLAELAGMFLLLQGWVTPCSLSPAPPAGSLVSTRCCQRGQAQRVPSLPTAPPLRVTLGRPYRCGKRSEESDVAFLCSPCADALHLPSPETHWIFKVAHWWV